MASLDRDYVLGVAVQLQSESIAEFEAQVKKKLEAIKPVKISTVQIPPEDAARLQRMLDEQQRIINAADEKRKASNAKTLEDWKNRTSSTRAQIDEETSIIQTKLNEQANVISQSADKQSAANKEILQSWEARTASVGDQLERENAIIQDLLARQQALLDANAFTRSQRNRSIVSGATVGGTLIEGADGAALERQTQILDRYVPKLNAAVDAQKQMGSSWKTMLQSSGNVEHLIQSMGNIATWTVGAGALFAAGNTVVKGFQDAIHSQQEQVIQGFYYRGQGQQFTPQMSSTTMQGAIDLARKYGDDVMQVQEAIGLWAKSTKGELLPSLEMSNEALKLNSVTGMNNEEIYRSTISVLSQYHESLAKANDIYNIGVGLATRYGGGIKAIGGEAQDAARQMIEAMDASSAVAASFGLKLEQTAGLLAVMIQTGNKGGEESGNLLSRALAAFERGKPEQALEKMGIAIHNNSKFLDELKAKWDQVVPGMGNTLGNIVTASVSSSANEALKLMISSLGQYQEAEKQAYEYEKSHPLDAMYAQMKDTDAFKINQLKASFESISIVVGRQFLDPLKNAMDTVEKAVPTMMSLGPVIKDIAGALLLLGTGWGAIEVLKLLSNAAMTARGQWVALANDYKTGAESISLSSQVATLALTNEQRQAIATLTGNATVTAEMETQWKALAISQGTSIDAMIGAMAKLKADTQVGASTLVMSEDQIATNMKSVALQLGVTEEQMAAGFTGLATSGESAAAALGTAFSSLIPVIGQVFLFAGLAKAAYDGIHDNINKAQAFDYEHNPYKRRMREIALNHDIYAATTEYQGDEKALKAYQSRGMDTTGISGLMAGLEQRIAQDRSELQDLISGRAWTQYESIDQQLAAQNAALSNALKNTRITSPGGNEAGDVSSGSSKADQALNAEADAIQRNLNLLTKKDEADAKDVANAKLQIKAATDKQKAIENLGKAYAKEISDREKDIALAQHDISHYNNLAAHATTGTQQQSFLNKANQLQAALQVLQSQVQYLKTAEGVDVTAQEGALLIAGQAGNIAFSKTAMKNLSDNMRLHTESTTDLNSLRSRFEGLLNIATQLSIHLSKMGDTKDQAKIHAWAETLRSDLQTIGTDFDTIRQKANSLVSTLSTETHNNEMSLLFPGNKAIDSYAKAIDSIQQKYQKYIDLEKQDPTNTTLKQSVDQWYGVATAVANANYAVAQYQQNLRALQNTPTYAAITTLGNDVGSSITSSIMSSFTNSDQNQVYAIESQIAALQNEKNLLQGKNNEVERMMLEQHIHQLEADKNGIEQRMRHPGFLKGIEEDMAKAVMKGLTERLTKDLQDAFANSILGKNSADNPQIIATNTNTTALNSLTNAILSTGMGSGIASSINIPGIGNLPTWDGISGGGGGTSGFGGLFGSLGSLMGGSSGGANTSSSAPAGGASSSFSIPWGGATAAAIAATTIPGLLGGSGFNFYGNPFGQPNTPDSTSGTSSGSASVGAAAASATSIGKQNSARGLQAIGGISAAIQGYDQGGVAGALETGLGVYSTIEAIAPKFGPWGIAIAAAAALASLFHPHYNPSQNPDMYKDSGFAQGVADAQGVAYTQASGWVYEDPGLKQQLGDMTELQYLNAWYNSYPGGQGLNDQGKQLWDEIGHITGNGKGYGVTGLHQGNVFVSTSGQNGSPQVGESGNWQTVLSDIDNATQQLYALENQDMTGKGTWISVNSYGAGGGGSAAFSPWYSPGLNGSDISAITSMPYPPLNSNGAVTTNPGDPSGGTGGPSGGPGAPPGHTVSPMSVSTAVYLNSEMIAQQVNAYNIQRQTSGWAQNY